MSVKIPALIARSLQMAAVLFALLMSAQGMAASLQVSPVVLNFQAAQAADGLWLSNVGPTPLQAQVRVFRWTQDNGEDVLVPTNDMVASPPMIVIQAGQRQMVRLVRVGTGMNSPAVQAAYRVVLDELPLQDEAQGVQFVLRYSIPIFVSPPEAVVGATDTTPPAPALEWSLRRVASDLFLTATNSGSVHAKVIEASFNPSAGKPITLGDGLFGYVLPKATRQWKVSEHRAISNGGTLNALVNDQAVAIPLAPAP